MSHQKTDQAAARGFVFPPSSWEFADLTKIDSETLALYVVYMHERWYAADANYKDLRRELDFFFPVNENKELDKDRLQEFCKVRNYRVEASNGNEVILRELFNSYLNLKANERTTGLVHARLYQHCTWKKLLKAFRDYTPVRDNTVHFKLANNKFYGDQEYMLRDSNYDSDDIQSGNKTDIDHYADIKLLQIIIKLFLENKK
jgi:hypothetical protein